SPPALTTLFWAPMMRGFRLFGPARTDARRFGGCHPGPIERGVRPAEVAHLIPEEDDDLFWCLGCLPQTAKQPIKLGRLSSRPGCRVAVAPGTDAPPSPHPSSRPRSSCSGVERRKVA